MGSKMLIDATHPEETRVVVCKGNRIEEFDFESAARRQLKGNIYLAKVTRVEPSLQAAFVDYGGNRHGFLAFAEIHPDYYQIPVADRQALLREQEEEDRRRGEEENGDEPEQRSDARRGDRGRDRGERGNDRGRGRHDRGRDRGPSPAQPLEIAGEATLVDAEEFPVAGFEAEAGSEFHDVHGSGPSQGTGEAEFNADTSGDPSGRHDEAHDGHHPEHSEQPVSEAAYDEGTAPHETASDDRPASAVGGEIETVPEDETIQVESIGAGDAMDDISEPRPRHTSRRNYKIQEVIKRRQIILIQVVKEERGNKGAALTTYLSLAGRYCVLMPNTARGGGISRKITDSSDRKRLKEVAREIEVPEGMGLIVRTAGAQRTKTEIRRDYDYLLRLWENVRDLTLQSQAPALVYEEGSLIKRAIRDLYTKDVDEVLAEGEEGYREAKEFMKMLMPSHARNVKLHKDTRTLFAKHHIETQLDGLFSPQVTLPSGGYLVINQAEALVAIDINSGKSTREHNIEDTALRTNLEAADEIARQLRLRDLAGLIVIDFIDMDEKRNNRAVERRMKDALKNDRARIQVGHISHFGLLEMSRQRLRPGLLEGSTKTCPHCEGSGIIRSLSSCALSVLRAIEDHLTKRSENLTVRCSPEVAFYILNDKRDHLLSVEANFGVSIFLVPDATVRASQGQIEKALEREVPKRISAPGPVKPDTPDTLGVEEEDEAPIEDQVGDEDDAEAGARNEHPVASASGEEGTGEDRSNGRRGRRRGRRGGRGGRRDGAPERMAGSEGVQDGEPGVEHIPGMGDQPVLPEGTVMPGEVRGVPVNNSRGRGHGRRGPPQAQGEERGARGGRGRGRRGGRFGRDAEGVETADTDTLAQTQADPVEMATPVAHSDAPEAPVSTPVAQDMAQELAEPANAVPEASPPARAKRAPGSRGGRTPKAQAAPIESAVAEASTVADEGATPPVGSAPRAPAARPPRTGAATKASAGRKPAAAAEAGGQPAAPAEAKPAEPVAPEADAGPARTSWTPPAPTVQPVATEGTGRTGWWRKRP